MDTVSLPDVGDEEEMTTASRIGQRWRRLEARSVLWKKRVGGCVPVVDHVADPVDENVAPRSFADPVVQSVTPSFGGDDL